MKLEFTTGCTEYRTHLQLPYYWKDEATGLLPEAIHSYLDYILGKRTSFGLRDFCLVVAYMKHFINAPCWPEDSDGLLASLRIGIDKVETAKGIDAWIQQCLLIGLDPL